MTGAQTTPGDAAAWVIGMDTLALASAVAAAAVAETELRHGIARAIAGRFADWVLVDLLGDDQERRAVEARRPDPATAGLLTRISPWTCPLIRSAVRRNTPAVHAPLGDEAMLGTFPGGGPVATALGARSAAVGPIVADGAVCGAITAVRCSAPHMGFRELGILAQIGEVTGAAAGRLLGS